MVGGILNINDMQTINLNGNKHDDKLDSVRYTFEKIAKKIVERQDNAMAMEFTKTIGKLLLDNNVKPVVVENKFTAEKENSITQTYGVAITELDFTEHDKPFKDKIAELEAKVLELESQNKELKTKGCVELIVAERINGRDYVSLDTVMKIVDDISEIYKVEKRNI